MTIEKGRKSLTNLHFGKIEGYFHLLSESFTSLVGFPTEVGKYLNITGNPVESLKKLPTKKVGGSFIATACGLTSLEGCPEEIGGNLIVNLNILTTLEGAPKIMPDNAKVDCYTRGRSMDPTLISLEGLPPNLDPNNINTIPSFMAINPLNDIPQDFLRDGYKLFKETGSWIPYYIKLDTEYFDKGFFTEEFILGKIDPEGAQTFINKFPEKAIVMLTPWLKRRKDSRYNNLKFPENLEDERTLLSTLGDVGL